MGIEPMETAPARPVPMTMMIFASHESPSPAYEPLKSTRSPPAARETPRIATIPMMKTSQTALFAPPRCPVAFVFRGEITSARRTATSRPAVHSSTAYGGRVISHASELRGHRGHRRADELDEGKRVQPDDKDEKHEQRQRGELDPVRIAERRRGVGCLDAAEDSGRFGAEQHPLQEAKDVEGRYHYSGGAHH